MSKRKRRIDHSADPLAEWREQMEHGHVPGYWASVAKLPPAATVRSTFGCSIMLLGGMLLLAGIAGGLAGQTGTLIGALGTIVLGGALLGLGGLTLRRRRHRRRK